MISYVATPTGFLVKVDYSIKDAFRKAFPSAKWQVDSKTWFVGPRAQVKLVNICANGGATLITETACAKAAAEYAELEGWIHAAEIAAPVGFLDQEIIDGCKTAGVSNYPALQSRLDAAIKVSAAAPSKNIEIERRQAAEELRIAAEVADREVTCASLAARGPIIVLYDGVLTPWQE